MGKDFEQVQENKHALGMDIILVVLKFWVQGTLGIQIKQDRKSHFHWYCLRPVCFMKSDPVSTKFMGTCLVIWMQEIQFTPITLFTYPVFSTRKNTQSFAITYSKHFNWYLDKEHFHILELFYRFKIIMNQNHQMCLQHICSCVINLCVIPHVICRILRILSLRKRTNKTVSFLKSSYQTDINIVTFVTVFLLFCQSVRQNLTLRFGTSYAVCSWIVWTRHVVRDTLE